MSYLFLFIGLLVLELVYFRIADRFNIIDKPNERSSHTRIVIRGGAIIVPLAALIWWGASGFKYPYFMAGLMLVSVISFLDDIYTLSNKIRLAVQFTAAALVLVQVGLVTLPWYFWIPLLIVIVGWKNAFNFMDGINGITALYTLSAVGALWYVNDRLMFTNSELLLYVGLAILVFSFFNLRKRAKCFAGDIGSVSIAFLLTFWMIQLLFQTGQVLYLLFVAVYGVDAVLTIVHRLLRGENIFEAHRSHLYQYMANERKMGHIPVALIYFLTQCLINLLVIVWVQTGKDAAWWLLIGTITGLCLVYVGYKRYILRKTSSG